MSAERRQLPRGGRRLRRARRRQAPGDGRGAVDLRAARARAAAARSTPRAASRRSCSSSTGARSRSWSRGSGTKSMIARQVLEEPGRQPLRRRRLRHGRRDPQRPLLRRRAAARRQRLLRDRRLGLVPAARARRRRCSRAGAAACADAGCAWGGGESPSLPGLLDERDIELAGRRRRRGARRAARRSSARSSRAGDEIVLVASSGLHANGASLARLLAGRLPEGYATRAAERRDASARRCSSPSVMYVPLVAELLRARASRVHLPQPRHRPRAAQADAPARARSPTASTRLPDGARRCSRSWSTQARLDAARGLLDLQHGLPATPSTARPASGAAIVAIASELGLDALVAGRVEEGPRQVILEPVGVRFDGARARAVGRADAEP